MVLRIVKPYLIFIVFSIIFFMFTYYFTENQVPDPVYLQSLTLKELEELKTESVSLVTCYYNSVMTQTLVGGDTPKKDLTKILYTIQALGSYILTAGVIVFATSRHFRSSLDMY